MNQVNTTYCLDTNVLIVAWNTYYAPNLCPSYWDMLNELGRRNVIYIPQAVADEITRTDDNLSHWLLSSNIPIQDYTEDVIKHLSNIYNSHPSHKYLVDNVKQRSIADPWIVAHALSNGSSVVTKEIFVKRHNPNTIRIPNVCSNLGIRCINDFEMLNELNIGFVCSGN